MNSKLSFPETLLANEEEISPPARIIYGTHTGNSQMLAHEAAEKLAANGLEVSVCDMEDFDPQELQQLQILLIIISTDGDGEVPLMAEDFYEFLLEKNKSRLNHISYSVLALGDTTYTYFCKAGKDFDQILEKAGAQKITERIDCDVDYEDDFEVWINNVLLNLLKDESQRLKVKNR